MKLVIISGDILKVPADTLICSANIFLNLSGGVGGGLRVAFGDAVADRIQRELHAGIAGRPGQRANPGEVFWTSGEGTPFEQIIHAIAIDGMYQSTVEMVRETMVRAMGLAAGHGARRVALAALGTGYGHLSMEQFGRAAAALGREFPSIETVTICVRKGDEAEQLRKLMT